MTSSYKKNGDYITNPNRDLRAKLITAKEELLFELDQDDLDAQLVYQSVERYNRGDPESLRQQSIGLIAELLSAGIVDAGDFMGDPWDCSPGDAIMRITREWLSLAPTGKPIDGTIVWLTVTDHGKKYTAAALTKLKALRESYPGI